MKIHLLDERNSNIKSDSGNSKFTVLEKFWQPTGVTIFGGDGFSTTIIIIG